MEKLAQAILDLTYRELRDIGDEFAAACEDPEIRPFPKTGQEFSDLLFDWAEAKKD